jgi:hypothetical protein
MAQNSPGVSGEFAPPVQRSSVPVYVNVPVGGVAPKFAAPVMAPVPLVFAYAPVPLSTVHAPASVAAV